MNKASAFRVRKRPVNQEKISRYISEHFQRSGSNDDLDIEMDIDSAGITASIFSKNATIDDANGKCIATPAGISVYTPSDPGLRTPLATSSPQGNSNGYSAASHNLSLSSQAQDANLYQYRDLDRQTPAPPSILSNPELFSTSSTPRSPIPHSSLANPAFNTPSPQPPSPALSISSIIRPSTSTFTGQSPAMTPRTLSILPQVSSQSQDGFQDQATLHLSDLSASAVRTRTVPQGRYKQTEEEQLREELSLITIMLGESHSEYLHKSLMVADIVIDQGRYRSAEEIVRKSLSVFKPENRDDIYRLEALSTLGRVLLHQGFYKQAEKIQSETLQSQKRVLGTENTSTLNSMDDLALTYILQGRLKEAEDLSAQVLEIRRRVLGQDDADTLRSMNYLAEIYRHQKQWTEAEDLNLQLIERQTRVVGWENPNTLISMEQLATLYMDVGRWKEAEDLEVQVLEMKTRVLGQEHPHTLLSMHNLACTWNRAGRHADSLKLMEKCCTLQARILGASHPDNLASKKVLLEWQQARGIRN
jgi:tetratricopeptide (TPR) repeat protein